MRDELAAPAQVLGRQQAEERLGGMVFGRGRDVLALQQLVESGVGKGQIVRIEAQRLSLSVIGGSLVSVGGAAGSAAPANPPRPAGRG